MITSFQVVELDEDMEICGSRQVSATDPVLPRFPMGPAVVGFEIIGPEKVPFVENVRVSWFAHEEYIDYELTNHSRHYVEIDVGVPSGDENLYEAAWGAFRKDGIARVLKSLGLASWGIGRGIVDRRGHDLFVVELDGLEYPEWSLYTTVFEHDTLGGLWQKVRRISDAMAEFASTLLKHGGEG